MSVQLPPIPQGTGGTNGSPLVLAINDRLRRISAEFASVSPGPPSMTTTAKNALVSPAEGFTVYDLTLHQLSYWNGTVWVNV